jgi:peptidoglycan-associated lipoprotein
MKEQQMTIRSMAVVLLLSLMAGCASTSKEEGAPSAETTGAGAPTAPGGAELPGADKSATVGAGGESLLSRRRIHFAFDSSNIDSESRAIIEAHAAHLAANPNIKLRLEGHCDERGTREYNLALGERRAQAVERLVKVMGVAANRVTVASYGEEKPLDAEHNESAWRLNRRVEIQY